MTTSSTLPVSDATVAEAAGITPVGTVVAACAHSVTWWNLPLRLGRPAGGAELIDLPKLANAYDTARGLVVERLRERASELAADAVVDLRLREQLREGDDPRRVVELTAVGTAVRVPWPVSDGPVLTTLTATEVALLAGAGWRPAGIVAATGAVYVRGSIEAARLRRRIQLGTRNAEYADFTAGVARARERALGWVERRTRQLGASGVVGLDLTARPEAPSEPQNLAVTAHAVGTAVRLHGRLATGPSEPSAVVRLDQEAP